MGLPEADEFARRVRAALAYANIEVKSSKGATGISGATMARIVSPTSPRGAKNEDEAARIAHATGVPLAFLLHGFGQEAPALVERVEALEHQMATLLRRFGADEPLPPPAELLPPPSSPQPKPSTEGDGSTPPDTDEQRGTG
jgi:hypothetical protein